jgi:hypothetical protein
MQANGLFYLVIPPRACEGEESAFRLGVEPSVCERPGQTFSKPKEKADSSLRSEMTMICYVFRNSGFQKKTNAPAAHSHARHGERVIQPAATVILLRRCR